MKVKDFLEYNISGAIVAVVDANRTGYMLYPFILMEASMDVVNRQYGDNVVIGFEPVSKKKFYLYIK